MVDFERSIGYTDRAPRWTAAVGAVTILTAIAAHSPASADQSSASSSDHAPTASHSIQLASDVISNPSTIKYINVDSCTPKQDIDNGLVDATLVSDMTDIALTDDVTLGCAVTGHAKCLYSAPNCSKQMESPHGHGKALDIDYVNGVSVRERTPAIKTFVQKLVYKYRDLRFITPWTANELRDCDEPALNPERVIYRDDHVGHVHMDDDRVAVPVINADPKANEKPVDCKKKKPIAAKPAPHKVPAPRTPAPHTEVPVPPKKKTIPAPQAHTGKTPVLVSH